MTTEQEQTTFAQFIEAHKISMSVEQVDQNPHNDWQDADHWKCIIVRKWTEIYSLRNEAGDMVNGHKDHRAQMTVYFSMGLGHHGAEPRVSDVLDSLVSDASGVENARSFEDWADEYGYDNDSRKAERTYKACQREARKLKQFIGEDYDDLLFNTEPL